MNNRLLAIRQKFDQELEAAWSTKYFELQVTYGEFQALSAFFDFFIEKGAICEVVNANKNGLNLGFDIQDLNRTEAVAPVSHAPTNPAPSKVFRWN